MPLSSFPFKTLDQNTTKESWIEWWYLAQATYKMASDKLVFSNAERELRIWSTIEGSGKIVEAAQGAGLEAYLHVQQDGLNTHALIHLERRDIRRAQSCTLTHRPTNIIRMQLACQAYIEVLNKDVTNKVWFNYNGLPFCIIRVSHPHVIDKTVALELHAVEAPGANTPQGNARTKLMSFGDVNGLIKYTRRHVRLLEKESK